MNITGSTTVNPEAFITVYVGDACRNHDLCYESYNANKKECDKAFLRDLKTACRENIPALAISARRECSRRAKVYYNSVRTRFGADAFNDAQRTN
jgi:hypothetical protein